ncbi:MAG: cytochrome b [SAR86 cluster bacterium]|uniref:Cytochrome b n=1 Tax=SAR86 cluster bacterium TaxID=2030880 RepID=A0A2A5B2B9_9GAMM|nr:MAG: cytochrome b [SAR86 cluster bacterium]
MPEIRTPRAIIALHWILAASVIFLFVSSWWMLALPLPSNLFTYRELPFQLHKNVGLTLLVLIVAMLFIHFVSKYKAVNSQQNRLELWAHIGHYLIYFFVATCCLSGYMSSSYSGWSTTLWWLVEIPAWTNENDELNILFSDIHGWASWALLILIAMHVAAALYHAFKDDKLINKMFRLD